jgi:hypothetical protein
MEDGDDVIDGDDNAEGYLTTETVKGASLALESVDDVEGGDGLALGVLSVGDGITDDTLEEGLQYTTGLFVDHGWNTLDTTTTSETSDSWLGDTLDVVSQDLAVTLGSTLSETLTTLSASSHIGGVVKVIWGWGLIEKRVLRRYFDGSWLMVDGWWRT